MDAGKLDRRIVIERSVNLIDATGDQVEDWRELTKRWASFRTQGGREFLAADAERTEARAVFTIRYLDGLTLADRVVYRGRIYDIEAINEIGRREGQQLMTVARK